MTLTSALGATFKRFVENNIVCDERPEWDDSHYHPIVQSLAKRTSFHPAWIDEKLRMSNLGNDLYGADMRTVIRRLKEVAVQEDQLVKAQGAGATAPAIN